MANENDIGGKVGLDITDFKTNIADLNRQIKVIDSGFKAAAAGMDDWGKSEEGLQARIKSLNAITDAQRQKVANLTEMYKRVAAEKGESSKAAQDLQVRINKETESLNKNIGELKKTTSALNDFGNEEDQASEKTSKFSGSLDKMISGVKHVGGGVAKAAAIGVAAVGTAALGAAAGAFKLATDVGKTADDLITLSNKTGISTKQLQEMQYASRFVDVELETMTGSMAKLTKSMDAARGGSKDTRAAFQELGVEFTDNQGNLKNAQQVWIEAIDALGKMPNETERNALSMKLFGKSAAELNPLIVAGADELARLGAEANKVGAVLSNDALAAAGQFDDMMQTLEASSKGLAASLGVAVLPAVQGVVNSVVGIVPKITEAIKTGNWSSAGQAVSEGLNGLLGKLSGALPGLAKMASTVIGGLASAIATAAPKVLPAVIQAAVQLLQTLVKVLLDNGPKLITAGIDAIMMLVKGIVGALPNLIQVAIQAIKTLADGIIRSLPKLITAAVDIIFALVDGILDLLPKLIPVAIQLVLQLANSIINALPRLIEKLPLIIQAIVDVLVDNLPLLIVAAVQIIIALAAAIIKNLPVIIKAGMSILTSLIEGVMSLYSKLPEIGVGIYNSLVKAFKDIDWGQLGEDIINGLTNGIGNMKKVVTKKAKEVASSIAGAFTDFFLMRSPSKLTTGYGENISEGLAIGIDNKSKTVQAAAKKTAAAAAKAITDTFNNAVSQVDFKFKMQQIDLTEYIASLEQVKAQYAKTAEQRRKIDLDIKSAQDKIAQQLTNDEKKRFDTSVKFIASKKAANELSLQEELSLWQKVQAKYKEGSDQRTKADTEVNRIRIALERSFFDASVQFIESKKAANELSLAQELATWERVQARYKAGSEERLKADKEVNRLRQEIEAKTYVASVAYIDKRKEANNLSLVEELAVWERVQNKYKAGTKERLDAEQNVLRVRKQINAEITQANEDFLNKTKEINANLIADEKRLNDAYDQTLKDRTRSIRDFAGIFDEVSLKSETSGDQLLKNLQGQVDYMDSWASNLESLTKKGVDQGLIDELKGMGPKAAPQLIALNQLTNQQLIQYQELWREKSEQARIAAVDELKGIRTDTDTQIAALHTNAITQLESLKTDFVKKINEIRIGSAAEFNGMADDMPGIGQRAMEGLKTGLESMTGPLLDTARGIASSISETIRRAFDVGGTIAPSSSPLVSAAASAAGIIGNLNSITNSALKGGGLPIGAVAAAAGSTTVNQRFSIGSVSIPAKDLKEMKTVQDFFGGLQQAARAR